MHKVKILTVFIILDYVKHKNYSKINTSGRKYLLPPMKAVVRTCA